MKRPPVRPLLGATVGLVFCAGSAQAAAAPATESAAPASKPGWVSRVAAESKKLAFWDKDKNEAAPAAPAPAPKPEAASAGPSKKRGAAGPAKPAPTAKPQATKKAAAAPPPPTTPPEPAPEKKSLFSKLPSLPSLPFIGKSEPPVAPDPAPEPATPKKKGKAADQAPRAEAKPSVEASGSPAPEEKKPGFFELGRLLPGGRKAASDEAPSTVAEGAPTRGGTKKPSAPAAKPDSAPVPAETVPADKPSLWARMAAAVTPNAPAPSKPPTTPVARGMAPLGAPAPDSRTFVITKDDSPFFSFGPQQATPPDAYLSTGTVVTLTGKNWGWANVQLPDGRTGVVDRAALRPALITDLIPAQRPGDPLMASLSPNQLKPKSSANFVLPAAEMPDLPTSSDAGAMAGNPLLLPFSPDDITEPGQLPPLPEIQPLPEPQAPTDAETPATTPAPTPEPAAPEPAAPGEAQPAPEPAPSEPTPAPEPAEPAAPAE
jgi:hypothetical protein